MFRTRRHRPTRLMPASLYALIIGSGVLGASIAVAQTTTINNTTTSTTSSRPSAVPVPPTEAEEITRLIREKNLPGALARADAFLVKNPRDLQVRFLRGVILTDQNRMPDAVAAFESLTQDFPELPEPYNNLAVLRAGQGQLDLARSLLQQAIIAQPNYVTAYENLGDVYVSLAAESYQRALSLDPNNRSAQNKLTLAREISAKLRSVR